MKRAPNILLVMADQLAAQALPCYGHPVVRAPHLTRLAARSAVFDSAYCNFPICAPSRASMLAGRLPHSIGAYDNASEFPSSIPTMAHYLTGLGYRTTLCGKMHFIGADQLHGFEERLTTDIYPSDFSWTPDFLKGPAYRPTGVSMRPVVESGPCVRSLQIDYDDEVEYHGIQKLYDLARAPAERPFFLTISFTHPHPPFVTSQAHWDLYRDDEIDAPRIAPIPYEQLDPHSQWLHVAHAQNLYTVTETHVRNARHAYYGMVSYIDDKVGRILDVLESTGLGQDTFVVFAVDHGEMLGERGMWFKQSFYEGSARVPLIIAGPGIAPRRIGAHVSLVDLLPTFLDFATENAPPEAADRLDGTSLLPLLSGNDQGEDRMVVSEYSSEGVCAASRMVREGHYKYVFTRGLPPMFFNLKDDPDELRDLAGQPQVAEVQSRLHAHAMMNWDPDTVHAEILASQKRRAYIAQVAERSGRYPNWAYQPYVDESKRYIRGAGGAGPTAVKGRARLPFVEAAKPDKSE
ncbi:MAG TPA: choline-sulfatase [Burkholderiales bacterium]